MDIQGIDRFHDGSKISFTVSDWHEHVRQALRRCDPVTENILEIVESNMLQADPKNRGSASEVAQKIGSCLKHARVEAEKTEFYKIPNYFKVAINQEQQQESHVIQDRMAQEGSEEWRYKYRSKAFIEATKEPLLGASQVDDHEGSLDAFRGVSTNMPTSSLQRSATCFPRVTGFGRNFRNTIYEPVSLRTQDEHSTQPSSDVLYANYIDARRLLELAGWNSGTLEIPQTPETAPEPTRSPQNPHPPTSSTYGPLSLRSPQGSTQPPRPKSNRSSMSLLMRKLTGTFSKSKSTAYSSSTVLSPVDSVSPSAGQESMSARGGTRGRVNSESSTHRYEKFDTYFKGRDIVKSTHSGDMLIVYTSNIC
jgi:hypothetical protein